MSESELPKVYEAAAVEAKWYPLWEKAGTFHAEASSKKPPFCIMIPPPNVTGVLHMGHALNMSLQDMVCRYKRMKGFNVLWLPGTDHAGIATQNVVEKALAAEGLSRQDLGREKFIERVWDWKKKHGVQIIEQLKRLGSSCDWERERFTMDDGLSKAVREAFVSLYEKQLIERDLYLINWCPRCHTALSDLEVEHEEKNGQLWYIKYPLLNQERVAKPGEVTVATTRPETMLGDTAVAVNPSDERYKALIGQEISLPLTNRKIKIIADHRVSMEFGTGAVKVTPAHDFNDFALGNDHKLERINLFTPDGKMNENASVYKGLDRFAARKQIVKDLEEQGFLEKIEPHKNSVGHCQRCHTVVEPYLSLQWFVRTKTLAQKAIQAVKEGKTEFIPANWTNTYYDWMENIKDWCISRQIWWGHRVPAWYCRNSRITNHVSRDKATSCSPIVSREDPKKCPNCGSQDLEQDSDVLDTWFSSGLWPMSTLGWPEKTQELKTFYPTSLLITGFDIIFFWVARMMMMGMEFQKEVPFKQVHIHALVRDEKGQKMSKSKGNVVDPLKIMDQYGTDAFRFTLAALAAQGRDVKLSEKVIEGYRNFANKIWNATRFSLMNLEGTVAPQDLKNIDLSLFDQWILEKQNQTINVVDKAYSEYNFDVAARALYDFFWKELCDWYLEFSKIHLNKEVLAFVLERSLRLLHPIMPFLTEELWQKVKPTGETIMTSSFPEILAGNFEKASQEIDELRELVSMIRNIRSENRINPAQEIAVIFQSPDAVLKKRIAAQADSIKRLSKLSALTLADQVVDAKGTAHAASESFDIFIPLKGLIDFDQERKRLEKEIGKLQAELKSVAGKLSNASFVDHAPPALIEAERARQTTTQEKLKKLEASLENMQ